MQQVEEAEVQVAALQAIVALQPLPPVQAHLEEQQDLSGLDQTSQAGPPLLTPPSFAYREWCFGGQLGCRLARIRRMSILWCCLQDVGVVNF
jgi:hypothetical protein